ncbi:MAG: hypothetical protein KBE16_01870, partial [Alphaproteobacteria bacterium]|nr:hypothetical protein [Alphaproteobacteria bacterium]
MIKKNILALGLLTAALYTSQAQATISITYDLTQSVSGSDFTSFQYYGATTSNLNFSTGIDLALLTSGRVVAGSTVMGSGLLYSSGVGGLGLGVQGHSSFMDVNTDLLRNYLNVYTGMVFEEGSNYRRLFGFTNLELDREVMMNSDNISFTAHDALVFNVDPLIELLNIFIGLNSNVQLSITLDAYNDADQNSL